MRLGCCLNMLKTDKDPIGRKYLETVAKAHYDYVELPLAQIMDLKENEFEELLVEIKETGIPCEVCNNFFPASVRLTGEKADTQKAGSYAKWALDRAARLGSKIIVFGSSGAKNIPKGFGYEQAFEQIASLLNMIQSYAAADIRIVIEPLNCTESNLILNLQDGERLMRRIEGNAVRLLVDYYHFTMEQESYSTLKRMMPYIEHVHFAEPQGRRFPIIVNENYQRFFSALKQENYNGRVSIEAYTDEPEKDISNAVLLREYM